MKGALSNIVVVEQGGRMKKISWIWLVGKTLPLAALLTLSMSLPSSATS